jgi:peroxiredoxin
MGYQILGISPDSPEKLQGTIQKHGLTFPLLSDEDLATSGAFGIVFQMEGRRALPVPAVYIVGKNGLISFNYVHPNYRVRLDPDVLLAAAKAGLKE